MHRSGMFVIAIQALAMVALAQNDSKPPADKSRVSTMASSERQFTGTLVDASCGAGAIGASADKPEMTPETLKREEKKEAAEKQAEKDGRKSSADRAAKAEDAAGSHWSEDKMRACPGTATTLDYGLVTSDGRFYKLDSFGNTKMSNTWKDNANWTQNAGRGPNVTVQGTLEGRTIKVQSIR